MTGADEAIEVLTFYRDTVKKQKDHFIANGRTGDHILRMARDVEILDILIAFLAAAQGPKMPEAA